MRIWLIAIAAIVVGTATGLGITWLEFHDAYEYFKPVSLTKPAVVADPKAVEALLPAGPIAVVVGGPKFDFGTLNRDESRDRTFVIRNEGKEPLTVSWARESCGMCIRNAHQFQPTRVPPGGSCDVIVTFATKKNDSRFDESAYVSTNDPRNNLLQLEIVGFVTMAMKLDPGTLSLNSIPTSEPTSVSAKLFGFHSDKIEMVKYELSDPSTRSLVELTAKPLDEAAIKAEPHAKAGLELQFQLKPGLPIGPFSQNVKITAMADSEHTVTLPMTGTVVGDLSVYGKNFDATSATLNIGIVNRDLGMSAEIFILAKGPHRHDVKLSVDSVEPADALQIAIGDPVPLSDGRAIKFPVKVTVPKGLPTMNRLGNQQGKAASMVLETNHPVSKKLPITIRFAVQ